MFLNTYNVKKGSRNMIKSLNESIEVNSNETEISDEKLQERLAEELEERMELGCWAHGSICFGNS